MIKADGMLYTLVIRINDGVPGEFRICLGKTKEVLLFNVVRGVKEVLGKDIPEEKDWRKSIEAKGNRRIDINKNSEIYIMECR